MIIDIGLQKTPVDGQLVTFRSPCDSTNVTGITCNDVTYTIVDSMGNTMTDGGFFKEGAMVAVIFDVSNLKAYLVNCHRPISFGQTDLTAGESVLPSGTLYFVYE